MSLASGIFDFLSVALGHTRIYPLTLPQGVTLPAHTFQLISSNPLDTHSSAQDSPTYDDRPIERVRMQFSTYGNTYLQAEQASAELVETMRGARGTWDDIEVGFALPDLALDDYEPDTQRWRRIVDVFLQYRPALGS